MSKKQIIAVFDVDQTILQGFSGKELVRHMCRVGPGRIRSLAKYALLRGAYRTGILSTGGMVKQGAIWGAGHSVDYMQEMANQCFEQHIKQHIYQEAVHAIRHHCAQGHQVILASASNSFIIRSVAHYVDVNDWVATQASMVDNIVSKHIDGPLCFQAGKLEKVQAYLGEVDVDWQNSYAYSDSHDDLALLEAVGNACVVNPSEQLLLHAQQNQWKIHYWNTMLNNKHEEKEGATWKLANGILK